jgi:hypothetical protein
VAYPCRGLEEVQGQIHAVSVGRISQVGACQAKWRATAAVRHPFTTGFVPLSCTATWQQAPGARCGSKYQTVQHILQYTVQYSKMYPKTHLHLVSGIDGLPWWAIDRSADGAAVSLRSGNPGVNVSHREGRARWGDSWTGRQRSGQVSVHFGHPPNNNHHMFVLYGDCERVLLYSWAPLPVRYAAVPLDCHCNARVNSQHRGGILRIRQTDCQRQPVPPPVIFARWCRCMWYLTFLSSKLTFLSSKLTFLSAV